jgi:DNA-binding LytR/AlgR family response regulator
VSLDVAADPMQPITKSALFGRRVLIVEDEFFLADELRQTLAEYGAEVLGPVATLNEGLDIIASDNRIDSAVLDVQLREKEVFAISAVLKSRKIPFVFTTGFGETKIPPGYEDVPRFEKPFELGALIVALEASVGGRLS